MGGRGNPPEELLLRFYVNHKSKRLFVPSRPNSSHRESGPCAIMGNICMGLIPHVCVCVLQLRLLLKT